MTIYLDVIFLENLVLNFIILYVVGLISKTKFKLWKILARSRDRSMLCNNLLLYELAKKYMEFCMEIYFVDYHDICIF